MDLNIIIQISGISGTIILSVKTVQWIARLKYYRAYLSYVRKEGTLPEIVKKHKLRNPQRLIRYIESKGISIDPEEKALLSLPPQ